MITDDQVKEIINIVDPPVPNKLEVIERFISDKKNQPVKINTPNDVVNSMLMNRAYATAKEYYLNEFKKSV